MITVTACEAIGNGKLCFDFDNGIQLTLYRSEARRYDLKPCAEIEEERYRSLVTDVVTKRAKKRALHLLEQMDRTEFNLREKLKQGGYPEESIDAAVHYVMSFHYLDDYRYACTYIRYRQERMSRRQLQMKLQQKGIKRDVVLRALEEEFAVDELQQIEKLLVKRNYHAGNRNDKEFQRTYQYLLRRGFRGSDIMKMMERKSEY